MFPIGGLPIIEHHVQACTGLENLQEILIIGSYSTSEMKNFLDEVQEKYRVNIRYLQEFVELGTAGGLYHFRDQIRRGFTQAGGNFFVLNGDICSDFPLQQLYDFHLSKPNSLVI